VLLCYKNISFEKNGKNIIQVLIVYKNLRLHVLVNSLIFFHKYKHDLLIINFFNNGLIVFCTELKLAFFSTNAQIYKQDLDNY
jgi:hypothetical protein